MEEYNERGDEYLVAFGVSERGAEHEKSGKVCQDSALCYLEEGASLAIAAVSDGHGGEEYFRSDRGAKFAVESAVECIKNFVPVYEENIKSIGLTADNIKRGEAMEQLSRSIVLAWNEKTFEDYTANPFEIEFEIETEESVIARAYGATLIAVAVTENYWFGLQIGDGKCVVINEDKSVCEPIPADGRCHMNITTSMCDCNAAREFRYYFGVEKKPAIFINTDGVDNSFADSGRLHDLYLCIYENFVNKGMEKGVAELKNFLPELTKKGSGDDVSVAGILSLKSMKSLKQRNRKIYARSVRTDNDE